MRDLQSYSYSYICIWHPSSHFNYTPGSKLQENKPVTICNTYTQRATSSTYTILPVVNVSVNLCLSFKFSCCCCYLLHWAEVYWQRKVDNNTGNCSSGKFKQYLLNGLILSPVWKIFRVPVSASSQGLFRSCESCQKNLKDILMSLKCDLSFTW